MTVHAPINLDALRSLHHWWQLAGVDLSYSETMVSLYTEPQTTPSPSSAPTTADQFRQGSAQQAVSVVNTAAMPAPTPIALDKLPTDFPSSLPAMEQWLCEPANLPELSGFTIGQAYRPSGSPDANTALVVAMPDAVRANAAAPLDQSAMALLGQMMQAIGRSIAQCYIVPISMAASADRMLPPVLLPHLRKRCLHHLTLIPAQQIILFGDAAIRCLTDSELMAARRVQPKINHDRFNMPVISTFHPGFLVKNPRFKREAWQDLRTIWRISRQ
jgi:DNA polymerase